MLASVSKIELKSLEKLILIYYSIEDKLTYYDREDLRLLKYRRVFLQAKSNDKKNKKVDNKRFAIPKNAKIISEETELALPNFNRNDANQLDMFSDFDRNGANQLDMFSDSDRNYDNQLDMLSDSDRNYDNQLDMLSDSDRNYDNQLDMLSDSDRNYDNQLDMFPNSDDSDY